MGLITIQTAGSFQSPTKTFRADHHGHAGGCRTRSNRQLLIQFVWSSNYNKMAVALDLAGSVAVRSHPRKQRPYRNRRLGVRDTW